MTRSKQYGKADRIVGALRRAHAGMVGWHTRKDIYDKACRDADVADQPRPNMEVGKRPAPVASFIARKFLSAASEDGHRYCKGHHVIGVECEHH